MQLTSELSCVGLETIQMMSEEALGQIDAIYLHWTAGRYHQVYPDYHISIDADGRIYLPDNDTDLTQYRPHTWRRNSRSVGIALCGCYDASASPYNMGSEPVTSAQIEAMSAVVATICNYADIDINNVLTHCEAAYQDGYGPFSGDPETKYDLWYLPDSAYGGHLRPGGEVIRGKALWYMEQ